MVTESEKLYTRKQLAELLGVHISSVYRYEKEGLLTPVLHIRNRPRYTLESLNRIAKENKTVNS